MLDYACKLYVFDQLNITLLSKVEYVQRHSCRLLKLNHTLNKSAQDKLNVAQTGLGAIFLEKEDKPTLHFHEVAIDISDRLTLCEENRKVWKHQQSYQFRPVSGFQRNIFICAINLWNTPTFGSRLRARQTAT